MYVGRTGNRLCPVVAMLAYLRKRGSVHGPLFHLKDGRPLTRPQFILETHKRSGILAERYSDTASGVGQPPAAAAQGLGEDTASGVGQPQQQQCKDWVRTQSRCWEGGQVQHIRYISRPQGSTCTINEFPPPDSGHQFCWDWWYPHSIACKPPTNLLSGCSPRFPCVHPGCWPKGNWVCCGIPPEMVDYSAPQAVESN